MSVTKVSYYMLVQFIKLPSLMINPFQVNEYEE